MNNFRAKIKNIEETEDAKQKLIKERMKKKEAVSEFVPTNMAVNFVQHNRCKMLLLECCLTFTFVPKVIFKNILSKVLISKRILQSFCG